MPKKVKGDPHTHQKPVIDKDGDQVNVIIDTPEGSRNKYRYDTAKRIFRLSKVLPSGATFPYNFGYIPGTTDDSGDALDVLVLMDEPAFVGCLIEARLIGVLEAEQQERKSKPVRNDRLIAVAAHSHDHNDVADLAQINPKLLDELEAFFVSYHKQDHVRFTPKGRHGAKKARKLIREGERRAEKGGSHAHT